MNTIVIIAAAARVLTLADALRISNENQPTIRQAHANTEVAMARIDEARAPLLPQLTATASYQRTTANVVARPGITPINFGTGTVGGTGGMGGTTSNPNTNTFNFWNFGLTLNQYIWDFGVTTDKWKAAKTTAQATGEAERNSRLLVDAQVR